MNCLTPNCDPSSGGENSGEDKVKVSVQKSNSHTLYSVRFGVNFFIKKVLCEDVEVSIFFSYSMGSDELKLL